VEVAASSRSRPRSAQPFCRAALLLPGGHGSYPQRPLSAGRPVSAGLRHLSARSLSAAAVHARSEGKLAGVRPSSAPLQERRPSTSPPLPGQKADGGFRQVYLEPQPRRPRSAPRAPSGRERLSTDAAATFSWTTWAPALRDGRSGAGSAQVSAGAAHSKPWPFGAGWLLSDAPVRSDEGAGREHRVPQQLLQPPMTSQQKLQTPDNNNNKHSSNNHNNNHHNDNRTVHAPSPKLRQPHQQLQQKQNSQQQHLQQHQHQEEQVTHNQHEDHRQQQRQDQPQMQQQERHHRQIQQRQQQQPHKQDKPTQQQQYHTLLQQEQQHWLQQQQKLHQQQQQQHQQQHWLQHQHQQKQQPQSPAVEVPPPPGKLLQVTEELLLLTSELLEDTLTGDLLEAPTLLPSEAELEEREQETQLPEGRRVLPPKLSLLVRRQNAVLPPVGQAVGAQALDLAWEAAARRAAPLLFPKARSERQMNRPRVILPLRALSRVSLPSPRDERAEELARLESALQPDEDEEEGAQLDLPDSTCASPISLRSSYRSRGALLLPTSRIRIMSDFSDCQEDDGQLEDSSTERARSAFRRCCLKGEEVIGRRALPWALRFAGHLCVREDWIGEILEQAFPFANISLQDFTAFSQAYASRCRGFVGECFGQQAAAALQSRRASTCSASAQLAPRSLVGEAAEAAE
ncbi:unnamed protein product, partial [Polarella glacialis]